jgi:thiosulfate/3-mercaptopyruvate sulfurtransferase
MNVKASRLLTAVAIAVILSSVIRAFSRSEEPWTDKQLKDPAALVATLSDPKAVQPVIFNIGPVQQIKGAIAIGPANAQANLDRLKQQLAKLAKDKEVIIYCGCCPFSRCPNVRPAFELLQKMKFKNGKLLNLPSNLNDDWISKGYPME